MNRYDSYKDSGVEWIGEIPEHWDVQRLKNLSAIIPSNIDKKSKDDESTVHLCNYVDVYKNDYITEDLEFMKATAARHQIEKLSLFKKDVIATKDSEDPKDIGVPALVDQNLEGVVCGYHLTLLRAYKEILDGDFLYWFVRSDRISQYFYVNARGITRYAIGSNVFKNLPVSFPSIEEQQAIAIFLKRKTSEIDNLISKKVRLIQLLDEEKTALINQAVTKGLNPSVPMKDSGVEWLGQIPEHWDCIRLKNLIKEPLKYGANEAANDDNPENPRYIRITDFGSDGNLKGETFKSLPENIAKDYFLEEGDILFARSGATVGKTFLFKNYTGKACFAGYLIKASFNKEEVNSSFVDYVTRSNYYDNWKQSIFQQATIQNIGADKYNLFKVPIPLNIDEQDEIVQYLNNKLNNVNELISKYKKEINYLREYKNALISDVVTGKVNVRNEVMVN